MHRKLSDQRYLGLGVAISGLIVVIAGAFGAHALKATVSPLSLDVFHTAVRYQAWHTLAALAVLAWQSMRALRGQTLAILCWFVGIVLFSGSLYALTFGAPSAFGIVTPFGGLALMAGWVMLGASVWRQRPA